MKYFNTPKINLNEWKFALLSQSFSLISFIIGNILARESATLFLLKRPATMVMLILLTGLLGKKMQNDINGYQIIGAILVILGIVSFSLNVI